jgi:hypothetical protein
MYSVDHLVQHHLKQMEKLTRQQEKAARKRERQQQKLEEAFAKFREEVASTLPLPAGEHAGQPVPQTSGTGLLHMLRAFLF